MTDQPQTPEPGDLSPLLTMAVQLHELYTSYQEAGFTRAEAFQLVIAVITRSSSS